LQSNEQKARLWRIVALKEPLERDRPGRAGWRRGLLDRCVGRLPGSSPAPERLGWERSMLGGEQRLLTHLYEARVNNPVVLSGDIHSFWVSDATLTICSRRR